MKKYSIHNILLFSFILIAVIVFISGVRELLVLEQLKTLKETSKTITEKGVLLKETAEFINSEKLILQGIINTNDGKEFNLLVSNHDVSINYAKNNFKNISFIKKDVFEGIENASDINQIINDTKILFFSKYLSGYSKIIENKENSIDIDNYYIEKFETGTSVSKQDLKNKLLLNLADLQKQEIQLLDLIATKLLLARTKTKTISVKLEEDIDTKHKTSQNTAFLFLVIVIVALFLILSYLIRYLINPITKIQEHLNLITEGELPYDIDLQSGIEINQVGNTINNIVSGLRRGVDFSNEIGKGNFETEYKVLGDNDELGSSLLTLREDLLLAQEEEKKRKKEDAERNRTNEGLTLFNDIMKQQSGSFSQLADKIISSLVKFTKSNQGALFFLNEDNKEDVFFELLGAYAYNKKKYVSKQIKHGEGLVGAVALEKYTLYMTDVPDEYIEIESGVGSANPRSILIVPLKVEEDVLGVIEIASFNLFEPYEIEMIDKIADSIASSLANVSMNMQTESLLERSKSQELLVEELENEIRQYSEQIKELSLQTANLTKENKLLKQDADL